MIIQIDANLEPEMIDSPVNTYCISQGVLYQIYTSCMKIIDKINNPKVKNAIDMIDYFYQEK